MVWEPSGAKLRLVCVLVSEWCPSGKSKLFSGLNRPDVAGRPATSGQSFRLALSASYGWEKFSAIRRCRNNGWISRNQELWKGRNVEHRCVGHILNETFCYVACMKVGLRSHRTRGKIHTRHSGLRRECVGLSITHHSDLLTIGIKPRRVMTRTARYCVNVASRC